MEICCGIKDNIQAGFDKVVAAVNQATVPLQSLNPTTQHLRFQSIRCWKLKVMNNPIRCPISRLEMAVSGCIHFLCRFICTYFREMSGNICYPLLGRIIFSNPWLHQNYLKHSQVHGITMMGKDAIHVVQLRISRSIFWGLLMVPGTNQQPRFSVRTLFNIMAWSPLSHWLRISKMLSIPESNL